jgi:DNA recombination protein RmuC
MGDKISAVTKSLNTHVLKHNEFVGSLERTVLPQARKMEELAIGSGGATIQDLDKIEVDAREPVQGRDLEFNDDDPSDGKNAGRRRKLFFEPKIHH